MFLDSMKPAGTGGHVQHIVQTIFTDYCRNEDSILSAVNSYAGNNYNT